MCRTDQERIHIFNTTRGKHWKEKQSNILLHQQAKFGRNYSLLRKLQGIKRALWEVKQDRNSPVSFCKPSGWNHIALCFCAYACVYSHGDALQRCVKLTRLRLDNSTSNLTLKEILKVSLMLHTTPQPGRNQPAWMRSAPAQCSCLLQQSQVRSIGGITRPRPGKTFKEISSNTISATFINYIVFSAQARVTGDGTLCQII